MVWHKGSSSQRLRGEFRITHVFAPSPAGGLESVVRRLAEGQSQLGHDIRLVAIVESNDNLPPYLDGLRERGVESVVLRLGARRYMAERRATARIYRQYAPDIVHTHGYRCDVIDSGRARRLRIPVVSTVHGFTGGDWKNRFYERLQLKTLRRHDAVVAVSKAQLAKFAAAGIRRQRVHVIPNAGGVTADALDRAGARAYLGINDGFCVGWVGRLTPEKGADVFINALKRVDSPITASVIGDGPERNRLAALGRTPHAPSRISWHGRIPDAGRLFKAFDVFVLSSRTEGTPIVLLEAMAAGVPIVASDVGGVPDVLSRAEAILVPSGDPIALGAAIRAVHADPEAAAVRARAAKRRLQSDFALEPWIRRYEQVYRDILPQNVMA